MGMRDPARRRGVALAAVAVLAGALGAAAGPARGAETTGQELPSDPLAGRQVFLDKGCNNCHAIWGEGGTLGPDLGKAGVWQSVLQLAGVLWNHSPEMIEKMRERRLPRPTISPQEMAELAAFLYFLNYTDRPGDAAKGEQLFAEKGCGQCHSLGGSGGHVGPPLDRYKRYASPLFLAGAMWSHSAAMARKMGERGVSRPQFGGADMADIFAYVQSASSDESRERIYMVPGSPAVGEKVFVAKGCPQCHAVRGSGGHVGPDLGREDLHRSVTEIAGLMWNHEPGMRAKLQAKGIPAAELSDQELSDLIAYLFFLQYFDLPGDAVKGQNVFMEKGCVLCHYAPQGAEKLQAPDLSRSPALSSPLALSSAMWNHAPTMEAQIRERGLSWPQFRDGEVRDLVAYLRSVGKARQ